MEVTKQAVEDAIRRIDPAGVASARWFGGKGRAIGSIELARRSCSPATGGTSWRSRTSSLSRTDRAVPVPLVADAGALRPAAEGDGTLVGMAGAIAEGRTIPALPSIPEVLRNRLSPAGHARVPAGLGPA